MSVEPHGPGDPDATSPRPPGHDADVIDLSRRRAAQETRRADEDSVHPSVLRMRAVGAARSVEDAKLIIATAGVVKAVRDAVLDRRGLVGVELGRTQSASVEQEVRNLAVAELQLATGLGVTEARTMVAAAMSPKALRTVIDVALRSGEAAWPLVRAFLERTTGLSAEQRLLVALALFGDDASLAHEDRLDPDGDLHRLPWGHARFRAALDAEVTACESADPDSERERRAKAYARRRMTLKVHDDGTATLRISGPAATLVAINQRVDRTARTLRREGDERTLDQLRTDSAEATLLYGVIPMPGTDAKDENGSTRSRARARAARGRTTSRSSTRRSLPRPWTTSRGWSTHCRWSSCRWSSPSAPWPEGSRCARAAGTPPIAARHQHHQHPRPGRLQQRDSQNHRRPSHHQGSHRH